MQKYLVVGLGNPGSEYENTRHNIGFSVLNVLSGENNWTTNKLGWTCELTHRGRKAILLKPSTFMNLSGQAARYHMQKLGLKPAEIIVVTDDVALDFGTIRLKLKGSDGGHNGLKSISELLNTEVYPRLRIGVGSNYSKGQQADYVLSDFSAADKTHLSIITETAADCIRHVLFHGMEAAMNRFNGDALTPKIQTPPQKKTAHINIPPSVKDS